MVILRRALLLLALAGCTFNPQIEVSKIVCSVGDDNSCPSGYTCTLTEASPDGLCCRGSKGICSEEPPALAGRVPGDGGDTGGADGGGGANTSDGAADAQGAGGQSDAGTSDGAAGGAGGSPTDAALPVDASGADVTPDLAPDVPAGPSCVPACSLGDKRCGPGGGVRQCVQVSGCPAWGVEMSCGTGGRRACAGSEPNARCDCPASPPSCSNQAGAYCGSATALETCLADADGCIYKGPTTTCPAAKPCTGSLPSASCSCGAPPAACMGASGNLCTGATSLITCGSNSEGCPAITAMKTCGASETCQGSPGSATCQCNAPPAACAGVGNGTVCAGTSVLMCSTTAGGCVTSSPVKSCPAGKPCGLAGGVADCRCGAVAPECASGASGTVCSGNNVLSCGMNADGCATSAQVMACPAGKPCGVQSGVADCRCAPAAPECAGLTSGTVCQGTGTVLSCGSNAAGCSTSSAAKTCTGSKQCSGAPADCNCVNPPSMTDCPAGMDGSRCVGNQVYTCGTTADGCRTLTKTTCSASGACVGSLPSAMCVSETSYGNATDLGGADMQHSANNFWGVKVQVTTKIWLKRFGLIAHSAAGHLRLVLYKDNGMAGMNSAPSSYVAGAFDYPVVMDAHEYAVNNVAGAPGTTPVILDPGSYWMLAVFEQNTQVAHGASPQFARFKTLMAPVFWNSTPPDPFGVSATDDFATSANYYLVGLPQ